MNKKEAEGVGASAKRVARSEATMRATPRGQRARKACDAKKLKKQNTKNEIED